MRSRPTTIEHKDIGKMFWHSSQFLVDQNKIKINIRLGFTTT